MRNRERISGLLVFGLSVVTLFLLAPDARGKGRSSFGLSYPKEKIQLDPLRLPATPTLWLMAALLAAIAFLLVTKRTSGRHTIALGLALALFVVAIIVWATAGKEFSLISMLVAMVASATPIALGAMAGILCERSGVVNIGIEGMMLGGAFSGAIFGSLYGQWIGLFAAIMTGAVLAALLAVLAVKFRVDQIIIGVVLNILVLGLTSFLTAQVLVKKPHLNDARIFRAFKIPLLADIPIVGKMFFDQTVIVYMTFVLVGLVAFALYRTAWGLRTRSVGENPKAADTLGINVARTRYTAVIFGGMVGGLGGAWFTIGSVGRFDEGMTAGRGFIGLAAMIFGAYSPVGAFSAALVFGFFYSLQQKFAVLGTPIPGEFLSMAPYLVTIVVVAGLIGAVRPPAAGGQPYTKE
ncbi:MAG: ABC transporter permease [Ilumatobacteraceae bacterium]